VAKITFSACIFSHPEKYGSFQTFRPFRNNMYAGISGLLIKNGSYLSLDLLHLADQGRIMYAGDCIKNSGFFEHSGGVHDACDIIHCTDRHTANMEALASDPPLLNE
jgi:hypothetical protein